MAMWLLLIVAALDYNCFPKCSSQYSLRRSRNLLSFEVRKQIGGGYAHQGLERIAFTIPASIIDFMHPQRGVTVLLLAAEQGFRGSGLCPTELPQTYLCPRCGVWSDTKCGCVRQP
jgi:hypothetical protein